VPEPAPRGSLDAKRAICRRYSTRAREKQGSSGPPDANRGRIVLFGDPHPARSREWFAFARPRPRQDHTRGFRAVPHFKGRANHQRQRSGLKRATNIRANRPERFHCLTRAGAHGPTRTAGLREPEFREPSDRGKRSTQARRRRETQTLMAAAADTSASGPWKLSPPPAILAALLGEQDPVGLQPEAEALAPV